MKKKIHYISKALTMSPKELITKIAKKIINKLKNNIERSKDIRNSTHINFNVEVVKKSYINVTDLNVICLGIKETEYLSKMYCQHRFDLLGSGWVRNNYTDKALGVEKYKYSMNIVPPSSVDTSYIPIDWQKDYKSGFRWSEKSWYKDIKYGKILGVDIKVPWELARLQHLPQLALFVLADKTLKKKNIYEFKYQILDFIKNNPPRFGVNWVCTMDVSIRVANMLLAYDMFIQMDDNSILDEHFQKIFSNSVYEHGLHIINNLEFKYKQSSNHYFSDIVGLLFVSAYLESSVETTTWLAFSLQELLWCVKNQFYEDGGNFESSTSYHRLSGELAIYATALVLGLKKEKILDLQTYQFQTWKKSPQLKPLDQQSYTITNELLIKFPQWYIDRLYRIGRFTVDISKPNGEIVQVGDNDNGRLFRLSPNGKFLTNAEAEAKYLNLEGYHKLIQNYTETDELFWDENILNHQTFISAFLGVYDDEIFNNRFFLEKSIVSSMAKQKLDEKNKSYKEVMLSNIVPKELKYSQRKRYSTKHGFFELKQLVYPDSGLYVFKAENMHLTISVTPLGLENIGAHTHNDKLSYELWLDGKSMMRDPGTYLYTPLIDRRNEFRSIKAHNVPNIDNHEQHTWKEGLAGLFYMSQRASIHLVDIDMNGITLCLLYTDIIIQRKIRLDGSNIYIEDISNKPIEEDISFPYYSNGYGKIEYV